jgi:pimeloyl-ACP methyl ester carboxylesterase
MLACGLPYATLGEAERELVVFDTVRINNQALEGLRLQGARDAYEDYLDSVRIHIVERRPEMPIDYNITDMVADYEVGVEELTDGPVDLLGIAGGGLTALRYAARNPEKVRRLVLLSSGHRMSEEGRRLVARWAEAAERLEWRRVNSSFMRSMFANPAAGWFFGGIAYLAPETVGVSDYPWDFIVANRAVAEADCGEDAERVRAPTLALSGAGDRFFPPESVEETARLIPDGEAVIYPKEGHGLFKAQKESIRSRVLTFLLGADAE